MTVPDTTDITLRSVNPFTGKHAKPSTKHMGNGKIILGTLSIMAASVAFFELFNELRAGTFENAPLIPALGILVLALWGITAVRSGIGKKTERSR